MKRYEWNAEKSKQLKVRHGVSFEDILKEIRHGNILKTISHPNQKRYVGQKIMLVQITEYVYAVPYKEDEEKRFLKTLYPSRKLTKKYLKERRKSMKKKFNPFKNLKLDPYEQEIEDAIGRGEFKEIPLLAKERKEFADAAAYTLKRMKKDARINIRVKRSDLDTIQQKAMSNGLPYQTLIATLLHHFAQGKITLTL